MTSSLLYLSDREKLNGPGEIAIDTTPNQESLYIRNNNLDLVEFPSMNEVENLVGDISTYWANISQETNVTNTVDAINHNAEWILENFIRKPVTVYETDGTTGLLGVNASSIGENWQLTNLDLSPYKYIKCYFKVSDYETTSNYLTPSIVIEVPLDSASLAKKVNGTATAGKVPCDMYIGAGSGTNPNDRNVHYEVIVAVDTTKTKFQVISQVSIYGTAQGNRNNDGRYLYKITGHFA